MRPALPLGQPVQRGVPAVGSQPRRIVQGNAGVVAELSAGPPLLRIFVVPRGPLAGEINLRERGDADECGEGKERETNEAGRTVVLHLPLREESARPLGGGEYTTACGRSPGRLELLRLTDGVPETPPPAIWSQCSASFCTLILPISPT